MLDQAGARTTSDTFRDLYSEDIAHGKDLISLGVSICLDMVSISIKVGLGSQDHQA